MVAVLLAMFATVVSVSYSQASAAQSWTLTNEQRRAYLHHYAPIIFKRANENDGKKGYDWITNFHFDQDGYFNTNLNSGKMFPNLVSAATAGHSSYAAWRLRPTLYTSLIEFMDTDKQLVLLYHIYHFGDENWTATNNGTSPDKIHDWERVEIHLKNVVGSPGTGETVNYVTITKHHDNTRYSGSEAKFIETSTGKHVMLWQAEWSNRTDAPHCNELRFVQDSASYITTRWNGSSDGNVDVSGDGRKNAHYIFVPDQSPAVVSMVGAKRLTYTTAEQLASGRDNGDTIPWNSVKRISYELQDLADIIPTHWAITFAYAGNWTTSDSVTIKVDASGVVNEAAIQEVTAGTWVFHTRDTINDRSGYPSKPWLWGVYNQGSEGFEGAAMAGNLLDWRGNTRLTANGMPDSANSYWWQHDYFVHYGHFDDEGDYAHRCTTGNFFDQLACRQNYRNNMDPGFWLTGQWYTAANGGFDGRWVQLFDDANGQEPYTPVEVQLVGSGTACTAKTVTAHISGGLSPYVVTWTQGAAQIQTGSPHSSYAFQAGVPGALTVSTADGQWKSLTVHCY
jgi:hypothetical protein